MGNIVAITSDGIFGKVELTYNVSVIIFIRWMYFKTRISALDVQGD